MREFPKSLSAVFWRAQKHVALEDVSFTQGPRGTPGIWSNCDMGFRNCDMWGLLTLMILAYC